MATIHYGNYNFSWDDAEARTFLAMYRRKLDTGETLMLACGTDDGDVAFVVTPGVPVHVEFDDPVDDAGRHELGLDEAH
ncbi:hypothetical protein [Actinomyces gaoshouyii]|uniref:hypothetical protein n=1 Tax=Actinomyces gaoshouyii TaxID=1960083 RepID=UPI0009C0251D|nr:hypothetical protein [Actinomyces gaoshouyii]ARD42462.1 hypothetical protein B6G06_09035 [Actinomyces gaoshouyii]